MPLGHYYVMGLIALIDDASAAEDDDDVMMLGNREPKSHETLMFVCIQKDTSKRECTLWSWPVL